MQSSTFSKCINLLQKNFEKMTNDRELLNIWYKALNHISDEHFVIATQKIMLNEIFAPNLATISKYCSEVAAPIEVDDTEAWGLVVKAINRYGYMRAEEAMNSFPKLVQDAVNRVGGFEMICSSEEPDVIRGQFNKTMAAINQSERTRRRERTGLEQAIALANTTQDPLQIESKDWIRSSEEIVTEGMAKIASAFEMAGIRREKK